MEELKLYKAEKQISEKNFGYTFGIIFLILGLYPLINLQTPNLYLIGLSFALSLTAFYFPGLLKFPTLFWQRLSIFLSKFISPIILSLVYLITLLPISIILRLFSIDIINKNIDMKKKSYWIKRETKINDMKNQF